MKATSAFWSVVANLVLICAAPRAADIHWTNVLGGNWSEPANWSPNEVPGTNDSALIIQDGTFRVEVDTNASVGRLVLGGANGTQILSMSGPTLVLFGESVLGTNGVVDMSNGELHGIGNLRIEGMLNWSGWVLTRWSGGAPVGPQFLSITRTGRLNIQGDSFKHLNCGVSNAGTVVWTGQGVVQPYDAIYNLDSGLFEIRDARQMWFNDGLIVNQGTTRKVGTEKTFVFGQCFNAGRFEVLGGEINFAYRSFVQLSGSTLLDGGTLGEDYQPTFRGGLLLGSGILHVHHPQMLPGTVVNSAQFSPGIRCAGRIDIIGHYHQASPGALILDIGGRVPGASHDRLDVAFQAQLGGTVNICLADGFVPNVGDRFEVMTFGSRSNQFETFTGSDVAKGVRLEPVYTETNLVLVATSVQPSESPRLSIFPVGERLTLCWPRGYEDFTLESTATLTPSAWTPVTTPEPNRLVVEPAAAARFFRLFKR
jgi:hypothetical protein